MSVRVIWHLGGEEMCAATQWPPQKHQQQPFEQPLTQSFENQKTILIRMDTPTNITLHRQNTYLSLDNIWRNFLAVLQKINEF